MEKFRKLDVILENVSNLEMMEWENKNLSKGPRRKIIGSLHASSSRRERFGGTQGNLHRDIIGNDGNGPLTGPYNTGHS